MWKNIWSSGHNVNNKIGWCEQKKQLHSQQIFPMNVNKSFASIALGRNLEYEYEWAICQCDQIARLFLQYLALYINEVFPSNFKKLPK